MQRCTRRWWYIIYSWICKSKYIIKMNRPLFLCRRYHHRRHRHHSHHCYCRFFFFSTRFISGGFCGFKNLFCIFALNVNSCMHDDRSTVWHNEQQSYTHTHTYTRKTTFLTDASNGNTRIYQVVICTIFCYHLNQSLCESTVAWSYAYWIFCMNKEFLDFLYIESMTTTHTCNFPF